MSKHTLDLLPCPIHHCQLIPAIMIASDDASACPLCMEDLGLEQCDHCKRWGDPKKYHFETIKMGKSESTEKRMCSDCAENHYWWKEQERHADY